MSTPKEKIAFFLQDLKGGGAERSMVNIMNYLAEQGYPIDLVLVRREGPFLKQVSPKVNIVHLGTKKVLFSIPALARYLHRERPAALLSTLVHVNICAVTAHKLARTQTRLVIREANTVSYQRHSENDPFVRYAYYFLPYLYPEADIVISLSNDIAEELKTLLRHSQHKIVVIHNPLVTTRIGELVAPPIDYSWRFGDFDVVIGVGRLVSQKDFTTLIRAFATVRQKRPAKLLILGEGPLRSELERLVNDLGLSQDVDMPGFVDNPYAYMAKASVFVLSSAWEGFSNVLIEAMACGVPIVATDCPGASSEILEGGKYGKLVPVGNAEAMAKAILETLENPPDTRAARERAQAFSVERIAEQYLDVLLPSRNGVNQR